MIDVVYFLGKGSQWQDNEIRYSLRSLDMHLKNYGQVWIIGEWPKFLNSDEVRFIYAPDTERIPEKNISKKMLLVQSDLFLAMNDDFYFMSDVDVNIPYYHTGTLDDAIRLRYRDRHRMNLDNTNNFLKKYSLPMFNYELHIPIVYDRKLLTEILTTIPDPSNYRVAYYALRSMYCNRLDLVIAEMKHDCKHDSPEECDTFFSSQARPSEKVKKFLEDRFPNKSKFEL